VLRAFRVTRERFNPDFDLRPGVPKSSPASSSRSLF
jgi:hypothetical protein